MVVQTDTAPAEPPPDAEPFANIRCHVAQSFPHVANDDEEIDDEDERVYFTDYTNCLDRDSYNDCFLALRIFRFSLTDLTIEKEVNMEIQINPLSRETCFQNADLYIQCVYTSYSKETNILAFSKETPTFGIYTRV